MFRNSKLNYLSVFTIGYLLLSLLSLPFIEHTLLLWLFALFHFCWFGLASSMYYHRYLTHRTFKLNIFVEYFFLLGGLIGLGGDPVKWAAIHRFHHQNSDHDNDSHSPKHGFLWAYYGWVLHHDNALIAKLKKSHAKDLLKIPHLKICSNVAVESIPHAIYIVVVAYFLGIEFAIVGVIFSCLMSYNFHWMLIASLCHIPFFGYRRFDLPDQSRNVKWLSFLSFGEAMHNNHHRYPNHINLSSSLLEFDFVNRFVGFLEIFGLASDVKRVKYEK
ncbi:MAG: acyl-CoA desaturase [Halobacteriovoraceae bacterium]|jgi:fatty-acid desaturase|nr:acyl-CoA desaturase [Halobacteriovoraceae bacterium]